MKPANLQFITGITMMGSNYLLKWLGRLTFGLAAWSRSIAVMLLVTLSFLTSSTVIAAEDPKPDPSTIEFFEKQVRPLLVKQCISCHGPAQQFSSLRVDSREALLKGGNRGPAIIPGDATLSLLAKSVRHEGL